MMKHLRYRFSRPTVFDSAAAFLRSRFHYFKCQEEAFRY
jgi:hypothetical protein